MNLVYWIVTQLMIESKIFSSDWKNRLDVSATVKAHQDAYIASIHYTHFERNIVNLRKFFSKLKVAIMASVAVPAASELFIGGCCKNIRKLFTSSSSKSNTLLCIVTVLEKDWFLKCLAFAIPACEQISIDFFWMFLFLLTTSFQQQHRRRPPLLDEFSLSLCWTISVKQFLFCV